MQLTGCTTVVTGAARGIGRAMALRFAREGSNLALIDLRVDDIAETQALAQAQGVAARAYAADVSDEDAVCGVMERIVGDFGRIDVLVNNAGIVKDALLIKVRDGEIVDKLSLSNWQSVIDVNLTGVFLCGREAATHMVKRGQGGVIINISSVSRHGNTGQTNYSAAKAGVESMAVVWAKELARFGIRAGAIAPGYSRTDILSSMKPELLERIVAPVPAGRLGEPEEIAEAALFIARNDFFTGRCLDLDGGLRI
ncbi:MAG: 3-oxoacyl-[acyl-carrier-protein] reductase FabG [Steroidobacteraceae bacterium]|nr:3-oxoacyl-[acyl-carrier-protein] reductase FabG [Steroidobacteraceae bacterium]